MMRALAFSSVVSMVLLTLALQPATPPRADDPNSQGDEEQVIVGCDGIAGYQQALNDAFAAHEVFRDYWINGSRETADIQAMDIDDVNAILDDGNALLDELRQMAIPESYVPGHEGVALLFEFQVRNLVFLTIDASDVPQQEEAERALALILDGELRAANACPDEVEAAGGFIFFPPDQVEDALS